jgi:hypothetical protein
LLRLSSCGRLPRAVVAVDLDTGAQRFSQELPAGLVRRHALEHVLALRVGKLVLASETGVAAFDAGAGTLAFAQAVDAGAGSTSHYTRTKLASMLSRRRLLRPEQFPAFARIAPDTSAATRMQSWGWLRGYQQWHCLEHHG